MSDSSYSNRYQEFSRTRKRYLKAISIFFFFIFSVSVAICPASARAQSAPIAQKNIEKNKEKLTASDELIYESIVATASSRAEHTLRERQDLYWGIATTLGAVIIGVIAYLGFGQIRSLKENLSEDVIRQLSNSDSFKDAIANQIEDSVLNSLRDAQLSIERQIDFLNLRSIAERMSTAEGFSNAERNAVVSALFRLKDDQSITNKPEFTTALEHVFSSFFQAGLSENIDALEKELSDIIKTNPSIVLALLPSLGYQLLGETDVSEETQQKFLKYCGFARELKYAEASHPLEIAYLLHFKPTGWKRRIEIIFEDADQFNTQDMESFHTMITMLTDPNNIAKNPVSYHNRISQKFVDVNNVYKEKIDKISDIIKQNSA